MKKLLALFCLGMASWAHADLRSSHILNTQVLQSGATFYVSSGTVVNLTISTLTATNVAGTTTNDNAPVGDIGQSSRTCVSALNFAPTATFTEMSTMTLSAGDYAVTMHGGLDNNSGTVTGFRICLGNNPGNDSTGCTWGDNYMIGGTSTGFQALTIANYRISVASSQNVYGKFYSAFSVAVPQFTGCVTWRRVR